MRFEEMHKQFVEEHLQRRKGERRGRLARGHGHAESLFLKNIWWPLYGNLEYLHPEYEVYDWNRRTQFIDVAFIHPLGKVGIEIDGFQSHVRDMDRERFNYITKRDVFLTGLGWRMIHFTYDDVSEHPESCRALLQLVISPYMTLPNKITPTHLLEREVFRYACLLGRPIRPKDLIQYCGVDFRTARKWLATLTDKGWLRAVATGNGIREYEVIPHALRFLV